MSEEKKDVSRSDKEDMLVRRRAFNRGIGHISRLHHKVCERQLTEIPIHRAQHIILMHLSRANAIPSQKELAAHLEISPAAVAVSLKKLEMEGYITRSVPKEDCRINEITLTEKGRAVVAESRRVFDAIDSSMFEGVTEEELTACLRTLQKVEKNLLDALQNETSNGKENI